jgi:hypothetical protein
MPRPRMALALLGGAVTLGAATLVAPAADAARTTPAVTVGVAHAELKADGTSTSKITVKVRIGRVPDRNAQVTFALSGSPSASCGKLAVVTTKTNRSGIAQTVYRTSATVGFCTATATVGTSKGTIVIDQTSPTVTAPYSVTLAARSSKIQRDEIEPLTITVENGGAPVVSDLIRMTETPLQAGACGSIGPSNMTTNAAGQVTVRYYGSNKTGSCQLEVSEAMSGATSNAVVIQQSGAPVV